MELFIKRLFVRYYYNRILEMLMCGGRFIKILYVLCLSVLIVQCSDSEKLPNSVQFISGAVNGVVIEKNGKNLVVYGDPNDEIENAEMVLFTHFRRDVVWAGRNLVERGALAIVPEKEKAYFTNGDSIWANFASTRFHDYYCQTTKVGIFPLKVSRFVNGDDILKWQGLDIKVLNTPGYTRGAVSYIADIDNKRFAFVGDLIYGDGKIFDLYSLQDSFGDIKGYHGYAARVGKLLSGLQLILEQKPDYIIALRGPVITDPDAAINKLIKRIRSVYKNYLSISAYRWYYPERMDSLATDILGYNESEKLVPFLSDTEENPPSWYCHIGNSNLVFADDSSAFLIDCGMKDAFSELINMKKSGRLKSIDGIFLTHYHDDHTDLINDVVKEFGCPVYVTKELEEILENPSSFKLPCLTRESITNLTIMESGQEMSWKEFVLTFQFFPGQTIFHDAVLFEKNNGESIFFIGDSFTPTGIDDYCLLNRNLLHNNSGYLYCLDILKKLPENLLLANQHVEPLFSFSAKELGFLTNSLNERNEILNDLFPFDDPNYGVDEQWSSTFPYGQKANAGETIEVSVRIFNHSDKPKTFNIEPVAQKGFILEPGMTSILVEPETEGSAVFKARISKEFLPGVSLLLFNVKFDDWDLREWSEALVEVTSINIAH
jgi:glyoxylase-like metal-dependent hydrolase (beta-lactamase superfamily II)